MDLSLDSRIVIPPDVVYQVLGDEAVLLDLTKGTYFGLDPVGTRMWQLVIEHGSLAQVRDALLEEYDVDRERLERDLLELGTQWCTKGLATVAE